MIKKIEKAGWYEVRQKGSHKIFYHDTIKNPPLIVVPDHGSKDLGKGLVSKILKAAGLK
ncbi:MAG: type II toxin-antitoxin system HicA family toxin [Bacteroidota bacterium]